MLAVPNWYKKLRDLWLGTDLLPPEAQKPEIVELPPEEIYVAPTTPTLPPPPPPELQPQARSHYDEARLFLAEKIWGEGELGPGKERQPDLLRGFGLNPAMSVLDMRAGLGGLVERIYRDYNTLANGIEPDALTAETGMSRITRHGLQRKTPIAAYEPEQFNSARKCDCIIVPELLYLVQNKDKFLDAVVQALKERGQISITDLVVDDVQLPDVQFWCEGEARDPWLWPFERVRQALELRGFEIRYVSDITHEQEAEIKNGLGQFLRSIDREKLTQTEKQALLAEAEYWTRRLAAFKNGLRLYHFFAILK